MAQYVDSIQTDISNAAASAEYIKDTSSTTLEVR